ncbi:hypothetical protein BDZ97DRAFT_1825726 [Flammula alnicola]|nr:hypothetical protein BDZ97DRAFT_1825726 [Flammula alnicola]
MPRPRPPEAFHSSPACPTCFDLDLRYIPQRHKDRRIRSVSGVPRHWISAADLAKDLSCASCRFLKSAFDTLVNSGEVVDILPGREITYSIAILDEPHHTNSAPDAVAIKKKREAAEKSGASKSLSIVMMCTAGERGSLSGDSEVSGEFAVEIYTPPSGEFGLQSRIDFVLMGR